MKAEGGRRQTVRRTGPVHRDWSIDAMGTEDQLDWEAIYVAHAARACRTIRSRFPAVLRPCFEPLDFVHDAVVTILEHPKGVDGHRVGPLLALIARCRMLDQYRRPESRRDGCDPGALVDRAPRCELVAESNEVLGRLMLHARGRERVLIALKRCGHSTPEAAALAGMGLRMAQRSLARLRRTYSSQTST
jgi:DNA-directed RNA polymerase specialized sigma24 family protein